MPEDTPQTCTEEFTAALIARDMDAALALLTADVMFFYSNGSTIAGKEAFASLMTMSWKMVEDYAYSTVDPVWLAQSDTAAALIYRFAWTGIVRGQSVGGEGRATRVFRNDGAGWKLSHEHLSTGDWKPNESV